MSALARRIVARGLRGSGVAVDGTAEAEGAVYTITCPPLHIALLMALRGQYWVPEAYARGHWRLVQGDLGELVQHMMDRAGDGVMRRFTSHRRRGVALWHLWQHWVTPRRATRAVRRHYDIDDRIYELILDREMVYTAAFFEEAGDLYAAQQAKMARVVERLDLPEGARVLDIGCGWGSLGRHLVRARPDAQVTGITISEGQLSWARRHNAEALSAGQRRRLDLRLEDFRDHDARDAYDGVCSVGLFEHVGRSLYADFFAFCERTVKPGGTIVVHTILKNRSNVATNRWIDRHIFPGGYIAALGEITQAAERSELDLVAVHLHGPENYGNTCLQWRRNLMRNRAAIMEIYTRDHGLSPAEAGRAFRTWEIYLAGAEAGFFTRRRPMQSVQLVFRPTGQRGAERRAEAAPRSAEAAE